MCHASCNTNKNKPRFSSLGHEGIILMLLGVSSNTSKAKLNLKYVHVTYPKTKIMQDGLNMLHHKKTNLT